MRAALRSAQKLQEDVQGPQTHSEAKENLNQENHPETNIGDSVPEVEVRC